MRVVYFIISVIGIGLIVWYIVRRLKGGGDCCGGGHESAPKRIKPKDRKIANYPYRYHASVEGMVCSNCLRRVENAFNGNEGIYARGSLEGKSVRIYSKSSLTRRDAAEMLGGLSYTITEFTEEEK